MPEVGIVMTLRDRVSNTMRSMINTGTALNKNFESLYDRVTSVEDLQSVLAKGIAQSKTEITKQTDAVKAAEQAWKTLRANKEASVSEISEAEQKYRSEVEQLTRLKTALNAQNDSMKESRSELRALSQEYRNLLEVQERASNTEVNMEDPFGEVLGLKEKTEAFSKLSTEAKEAEQGLLNTCEALRRVDDQAESDIGYSADGGNILSTLAKAGLGKQLGEALSGAAGSLMGSVLSDEAGTMVSSLASGIASGAAIGSIAGPLGTAIGAAVGGASGLITGGTRVFEARDDAFQEYYASLYDTVSAGTSDAITSGSTIAGSREQTRMAFTQRLGSEAAADDYLSQVQEMATRTNYDYDTITGYAKLLLNSYSPDETFSVLQSLSDATAGLNLSDSDVTQMISGLSRMRTTDKATMEYLNYFSERGVDVYEALSQALGVDKSDVAELVSDSEVGGTEAAQAILDYIDDTFGGLSDTLASSYDATVDNLEDVMSSIKATGGEAYNETRLAGKEAELEAYDGLLGDAVAGVLSIAGENQAYLENLSDRYQQEALSAVLLGQEPSYLFSEEEKALLAQMHEDYAAASAERDQTGSFEAGEQMTSLYEQAQALATVAYEASDQYQQAQETELDQIAAIRDSITATDNLTAALNSYRVSQEQSKGMGGGILDSIAGWLTSPYVDEEGNSYAAMAQKAKGYATGLTRVPYDNYLAYLHEGERVLTAGEARAQDRSTAAAPVISGNNFYIREESDIDKVAAALLEKMQLAAMTG